MSLRVVSYNLLAPLFVNVPGQSYAQFGHAAPEDLEWSARRPRIEARLRALGGDVVCLQEVEYEPGDEAGGALPFVPPAWLEALARELGMRVYPEIQSPGSWRSRANRNLRKAGRAACAGLATLVGEHLGPVEAKSASRGLITRFGPPEERFTVVNVHLEGHPDKGKERVKQLRGALRRARAGSSSHTIVVGDWNTSAAPGTPVGQALAELEGMARAELGPTWAGVPGAPREVDQLLYDTTLELTEVRVELSSEDRARGTPNSESPSDHAPVLGCLRPRAAPRPAPAASGEAPLSAAEAEKLEREWRALLAEAPPKPAGAPSAETLAALRVFKERKKAFIDGLPSDRHRSFVKRLG